MRRHCLEILQRKKKRESCCEIRATLAEVEQKGERCYSGHCSKSCFTASLQEWTLSLRQLPFLHTSNRTLQTKDVQGYLRVRVA